VNLMTLDIDWAPDFVIDHVAELLTSRGVKATWFVTHASPAVSRLGQCPELFELGIHPNFLPGSSHGVTPSEVLAHCMELVPEARCVRTHNLVQSSPILSCLLGETPIRIDASLFLPGETGLRPFRCRHGHQTLVRVPFIWEDDVAMLQPEASWGGDPFLGDGLRVVNFHPIHVFLNSCEFEPYALLKQSCPKLQDVSIEQAREFEWSGDGTGTLFDRLTSRLSASRTFTVTEAVSEA
jgi:hypothetical protein